MRRVVDCSIGILLRVGKMELRLKFEKRERRRDNSNSYPLSLSYPTYTTSGSDISPPVHLMAGKPKRHPVFRGDKAPLGLITFKTDFCMRLA